MLAKSRLSLCEFSSAGEARDGVEGGHETWRQEGRVLYKAMSRANASPEQIGEELLGIEPSVGSADCRYGPGPGAPLIAVFDEWVIQKVSSIIRRVPRDLIRIYGFHDYHYITCSCYQRKPFMGSAYARDVFVEVCDEVRARYRFEVLGYVVMPEHFHFMITEPHRADPSVVMKALKQTVARRLLAGCPALSFCFP